jgi:hypothetical protein
MAIKFISNEEVTDETRFLRVNHYLHDFAVYTGRGGDPRTTVRGEGNKKLTWSRMAHGRDRITCDHMAAWVNEFVHQFGIERAKFMLNQKSPSLFEYCQGHENDRRLSLWTLSIGNW